MSSTSPNDRRDSGNPGSNLPVTVENGYRVNIDRLNAHCDEVFLYDRIAPVLEVTFEPGTVVVAPKPSRFTFRPDTFRIPVDLVEPGRPQYPDRDPVYSESRLSVHREDEHTDTVVVQYEGCRIPIASFNMALYPESDVLMRCPGGADTVPGVSTVEI